MRTVERHGLGWSIAAAIAVTSVFVLSNAPTPLYVAWQREWGFSSGTLTVVFACYMAGLVGTLTVAGRLADRYGRRVVLLPALAAAIVSALLFLFAQNVVWLLVARLLAGISVGGSVTAGMAAVVDLAPAARRRIGGLFASVSMVLGAGLGPLLSGSIARQTGTPQPWVFGLVTALTVIAFGLGVRLPLDRPVGPVATGGRLWRWPRPPRDRRRELVWGAVTFGPGITATSFVLSLGPSVLAGPVGVRDPFIAGLIACAMFLVATGIQFAVGGWSTRTQLAVSSIAAVAAMVLLGLAVTGAGRWPMFLVAALLSGAAQGLGQLAGLTLIATRIAPDRRAESNAALNISGYLPAGALPVATGYLADAVGLPVAVLAFAAVLGVFAVIALPLVRISTGRHLGAAEESSTARVR
ncbi:MFS transporter [Enemella evansiae]|uniref:MFS transporter n=1 Tax=Enemella evansiae TaxID=2016499 RepID=A0A255GF68_9ACTN|nr:MFS transporter [Enemella evansiae]OYO05089.1 MFS transporter [Enemella evansiae]OYO07552.1 MFS transporter [Enemella evansiae]OYO14455.1 MFS transporter [Enemella evansiae]